MKRKVFIQVLGMALAFAMLPVGSLQAAEASKTTVADAMSLQEQEEQKREEMLRQTEEDYEQFLQEKKERESKSQRHVMKQRRVLKKQYQEVLPKTEEELAPSEQKQVVEAMELSGDPVKSAEKINSYEDAVFEVSVREVLDEYYKDADNVKQKEVEVFSENIDTRAAALLKGYEEAFEERQRSEQLEYETETVMVMFEDGMTYERAKEITDHVGGEARVLDGTGRTLEECVSSQADEGSFRLIVGLDIGISQTVESAVGMLESIEGVDAAAPNGYLECEGIEDANDPLRTAQPYLRSENVSEAWDAFTKTYIKNYTKTKVAVIDTGVDVAHEDLKDILSWDSVSFDSDDPSVQKPFSIFTCEQPYRTPHGTAVAGIVAAKSNNGIGMTGIGSVYDSSRKKTEDVCEILAINAVLGIESSHHEYALVDGIRYAISHGADVINMSFGQYSAPNPIMQMALQEAHKANIVLVASAGNKNTTDTHYPSCYENVISVAALDSTGTKKADFSNYGNDTDISAVGDNMWLLKAGNPNEYLPDKGTSYSAPQVAAAAALIRAIYPDMIPERVEFILTHTADSLSGSGWNEYTGYGRVNIGHAVQYAKILQFMTNPVEPKEVKVTPKNSGQIEIDIEVDPLTEGYDIMRAEEANGEYKIILSPGYWLEKNGHIVYSDTNTKPGKTYYYMVKKRVYGYYNGMVTTYSRILGSYSATSMLP